MSDVETETQRLERLIKQIDDRVEQIDFMMLDIDDKVDDIWHALYKKRGEPWTRERSIRHQPSE